MRKSFCWFVLLPAVQILGAAHALASAWTQPEGRGQLVLTGTYTQAASYYDNSGRKRSQPRYGKYELTPYAEYGLAEGFTAAAKLSLQRTHQDAGPGAPERSNYGIGDTELFLRARLWAANGFAFALEPMLKLASPDSAHDLPRLGSSHSDAGLGLSGGYDFAAWGQRHFADLGVSYRYRMGTPHNRLKIDAALGLRVNARWTIMPQAFVTRRVGDPAAAAFTQSSADDYDQTTLQLSALYSLSDATSLQFGGFSTVDGKNTGAGDGVLVGLWQRF